MNLNKPIKEKKTKSNMIIGILLICLLVIIFGFVAYQISEQFKKPIPVYEGEIVDYSGTSSGVSFILKLKDGNFIKFSTIDFDSSFVQNELLNKTVSITTRFQSIDLDNVKVIE